MSVRAGVDAVLLVSGDPPGHGHPDLGRGGGQPDPVPGVRPPGDHAAPPPARPHARLRAAVLGAAGRGLGVGRLLHPRILPLSGHRSD